MKIERDKWYLTRNGGRVRVVCVDAPGSQQIVGILNGSAEQWCPDGSFWPGNERESPHDLVSEYHPPAPLLERWANVYPGGEVGSLWITREQAVEISGDTGRVICFREVREDA